MTAHVTTMMEALEAAAFDQGLEVHGLDFAATYRTLDGRVVTCCTCGWHEVAVDAAAGFDVWHAHRNGALR